MPRYRIVALEIHTRNHYIEATSPGEAIVKFLKDDFDSDSPEGSEFSSMADKEGSDVQSLLKHMSDRDLVYEQAGDLILEDSTVPAVWAIYDAPDAAPAPPQ